MLGGILVWNLLIDPAHTQRLTVPGRIMLAVAVFLLGDPVMATLFSGGANYPHYAAQPDRLLGIGPRLDQRLAGTVMLVEQIVTLGTCCAVLLWPYLQGRAARSGGISRVPVVRVAGGLGPGHLQLAPRGCVCEARAPLSTGALRRGQEPVHHPCREPNATTPRAGSRSGDRSVTTRWRVSGEFRSGWMVGAMPGCVWGWLRPSRAFGSAAGQAGGPGQGRAGRSCAVSGPPARRGQVWHQPSRISRMPKTRPLPAEPQLLNRELSWLDFNERVLELAADESMPLLERVKFCAIFSSNLDEFFMVRVAGLMDQAASGLPVRSHDGLTPREALAAIRERVDELTGEPVAPLEEGRPGARRRGDPRRPRRRLPRRRARRARPPSTSARSSRC